MGAKFESSGRKDQIVTGEAPQPESDGSSRPNLVDLASPHEKNSGSSATIDVIAKAEQNSIKFTAPKYYEGPLPVHDSISTRPSPRTEPDWMKLHESFAERAKQGGVDTLFLGDSITYGMNADILRKDFGPGALNFGIGGDRTQHLLWRMQNGELNFPKDQKPEVAVMLIGTNNLGSYLDIPPAKNKEIVEGIKANINELRKQLPDTKILVVGLLPRGETEHDDLRKRVNQVNAQLPGLTDGRNVFVINIGDKLVQPDGKISREVMDDFLHPTHEKGNEIMLGAIKPYVDKLKSN